ncbi:MAG TPA: addiction module protein [Pyrinomonadaceae bacterium]|nr:addiction module protein [Pyrinomonadaceae bacterium]
MSTQFIEDAKRLPLPERVELIEALWESIATEGYEPPLTAEQADELDRRLEAHNRDPDDVVSWDSIKADLAKNHLKD